MFTLSSAVLAARALTDRPGAGFVAIAAWCGLGLLAAVSLSRRGHEFRHLGALGVVLGPLLHGFGRASLRPREDEARPVVLRQARDLGAEQRLLLVIAGDPAAVADALPVLRLLEGRLRSVDLARPVTYDAARADPDDRDRAVAVRALQSAALFLDDLEPGLVLLPGAEAATTRFAADLQADVVVVVGDGEAQSKLCRTGSARTLAVMLGDHPVEADPGR